MIKSRQDIEQAERIWRLNLINSISGIKPANLIGTRSSDGLDNLAIFSSVVHLGSNPAQLGFVLRPQPEIPGDTYRNIQETGCYTINHIPLSLIKKAHYTSAKFPNEVSEFERMKIDKEFIADFPAPFVKESPVKIGMRIMESIPLPNNCSFIIGSVELIAYPEESINDLGQLNLADFNGIGISGLNTYYSLTKLDSFPYARAHETPDFE